MLRDNSCRSANEQLIRAEGNLTAICAARAWEELRDDKCEAAARRLHLRGVDASGRNAYLQLPVAADSVRGLRGKLYRKRFHGDRPGMSNGRIRVWFLRLDNVVRRGWRRRVRLPGFEPRGRREFRVMETGREDNGRRRDRPGSDHRGKKQEK